MKTNLDIQIASTNQLSSPQFAELRKLWVHGVQKDTNAVGWLPTSVFDSRAATNDVNAVYRDGELVGWSLSGESSARKVLKIYQIWVRPDARILEHGRALIDQLRTHSQTVHCLYLEAWVAEDLAANFFWDAIGFVRDVWRWGRGKSLRKIYRWVTTAEKAPEEMQQGEEFNPIETYDNPKWRHTQHNRAL